MFNTVKYVFSTQYVLHDRVFKQFGSADFWPKMDPIRQNHPNVYNSFPMHYVLFNSIKAHWKAVFGAETAKKAKNPQILQPYNTSRFVQYGQIRVKYDTAQYFNTPFDTSLKIFILL